jgi:HD superfamily phosphohydrolase
VNETAAPKSWLTVIQMSSWMLKAASPLIWAPLMLPTSRNEESLNQELAVWPARLTPEPTWADGAHAALLGRSTPSRGYDQADVYGSSSGASTEADVKFLHEIRDPVYGFVTVNSHERRVVDSAPVQRLRHVSQLAMSSLVYPGATHKRFEHSLGVMHLAGEAFDVLTRQENVSDAVRDVVPELNEPDNLPYWKSVIRMAALCHDLGHLPFSHAAEQILPPGVTHETLSEELILSPDMEEIFASMIPPLTPKVVAKLAVGPSKSRENFGVWEAILTEIVTGDAFGVDRMDYLLRDSLHAGVAYGRFDYLRILQTLRLLQMSALENDEESLAPSVGVQQGGLNAAEALLLARYFMFSQVYFHPVRIIYDIHLADFLKLWLPGEKFSGKLEDHLRINDNDIWVAIRDTAHDVSHPAHNPAQRIYERKHFKLLYSRRPSDVELFHKPGHAIASWAKEEYGSDAVRYRASEKSGGALDFLVQEPLGTIASSTTVSDTLRNLPPNTADLVFIRPDLLESASLAIKKEDFVRDLLAQAAEEEARVEDDEAAAEPAIRATNEEDE